MIRSGLRVLDTSTITLFNCVDFLSHLFLSVSGYEELSGLIVLNPGWLMEAMKDIVELDSKRAECDGLKRSDVNKLERGIVVSRVFDLYWKKFVSGASDIEIRHLCLIFQAYGLIYPLQCRDGKLEYIIPCKFKSEIENKRICKVSEMCIFYFDFYKFLPEVIYHRLICLALKNRETQQQKKQGEYGDCFSKNRCYLTNINGRCWLFQMEEETQRLKIMFQ